MYKDFGKPCPWCMSWVKSEMKIEVSQVNWNNRTGLFTVYGRATCRYCQKTMNGKNRSTNSVRIKTHRIGGRNGK